MPNVSVSGDASACCASDSARSREEPESVRFERVTLHADQARRARAPFALAEHERYDSRRRPQATGYLAG